jgi:hypothetical protein
VDLQIENRKYGAFGLYFIGEFLVAAAYKRDGARFSKQEIFYYPSRLNHCVQSRGPSNCKRKGDIALAKQAKVSEYAREMKVPDGLSKAYASVAEKTGDSINGLLEDIANAEAARQGAVSLRDGLRERLKTIQ